MKSLKAAAAKRVAAVDYQAGGRADVHDAMIMHTYQISAELRRVPERERLETALRICRRIVTNTRESLG